MAMSAVRRPSAHRDYIHQVAKQTIVMRLQGMFIPHCFVCNLVRLTKCAGFLFFGTIARVEEAIRELVEPEAWSRHPIRFLVIDLSLVAGVDMSAAEAFVRVQRLLAARNVTMCFCGFSPESSISKSLQNSGLFDEDHVEVFANFNDAMECKRSISHAPSAIDQH